MKNKSLFDHIGHITQKQTKGYWNSLNETEKKQWSNYMIHRFLSMKMEWADFVNEIQKLNLKPKQLYLVYSNVLPKGKQYLKYTKRRNDMALPKWFVEIMVKHYECSTSEVSNYVDTLVLTEQGALEIREVLQKYGVEPKKWKELPFNVQ